MGDAWDRERPATGQPDRAAAPDGPAATGSRLAWKQDQLRGWDLLHLSSPWLLLAISATIYFAWALPRSGADFRTDGAAVLSLVVVAALWVLVGHTVPVRRRTLRPVATAVFFVGLLALCGLLMSYSEVFLVFTISGFFAAYLLRPWQLGLLGVLGTSILLNTMTILGPAEPSSEVVVELVLIVLVQTAAIGAGIVLMARSEPVERRREELVEQLESALHENAGLHAQLVVQARESGIQDERQRLAGEIHDTLAQGFTGIITQLQVAERTGGVRAEAEEHVERALELARDNLAEARRSVRALAPAELEQAQLPEALRVLSARWSQDHALAVQVEVTGAEVPLSPAIEESLFRVAREALTNVAKHAAAVRVGLTLSYAGTEVLLDVRDDGRGFDEEAMTTSGFGLTSMRQRIRGLGGHLEVQSASGEGTAVSARVPAFPPGGHDGVAPPMVDQERRRTQT